MEAIIIPTQTTLFEIENRFSELKLPRMSLFCNLSVRYFSLKIYNPLILRVNIRLCILTRKIQV